MRDQLIIITSYPSIFEAEIAKGKLNASGIKAFISRDDCGGAYPAMQLAIGVNLLVKQRDIVEAKTILNISKKESNQLKFDLRKNKDALFSLLIIILNSTGISILIAGDTVYIKIFGLIFLIVGIAIWSFRRIFKHKKSSSL